MSCIGKDDTRSPLPIYVINKIIKHAKPKLTPEALKFLSSRIAIPYADLLNYKGPILSITLCYDTFGSLKDKLADESRKFIQWGLQAHSCTHTIEDHKGLIYSAAFNPDNATISLWDLQTQTVCCSQLFESKPTEFVTSNLNETQFVSTTFTNNIKLWDLRSLDQTFNKLENKQFTLEETELLAKYAPNQGNNLTHSQQNKLTQMGFKLT